MMQFLKRYFSEPSPLSKSIGNHEFRKIVRIDDLHLGSYCLLVLASILLNWGNPDWNAPVATALWIVFTAVTLLSSRWSMRTGEFRRTELFRSLATLVLQVPIFFATGGYRGQFWYGFAIMTVGLSTLYLAVHLKRFVPLAIFGATYGLLCLYDHPKLDRWAVGQILAQTGFIILIGAFLTEIMHYLLVRTQELDQQRTALAHAAKMSSLGEMAGGIAHEINNPLAIIQANAQFLQRAQEADLLDKATALECLEKINRTCKRIATIVSGLRSFAKDTGGEPFQKASLGTVLADTLVFCEARFKHHNVNLEVLPSVPDLRRIELDCRPVQISQVILNLLNNSFDAIEPMPDRWIRLRAEAREGLIQLSVTDSGEGIPCDVAERLMQPFFTTKALGKGTGLGLSISKGIVESHGGKIYLDRSAQNTRFVVELPASQLNS